MICQYFKLPARREDVMQELSDFSTWMTWWPGLHRLHVVADDGRVAVVDAMFKLTVTVAMRVEFIRQAEHVITFRQMHGWFKKYEGEWLLQRAPHGTGTVLKATTQLECSGLIPKSMVQSKYAENLTRFGAALAQRLQRQGYAAPTPGGAAAPPSAPCDVPSPSDVGRRQVLARKPILVFQTTAGLEVWIEGRRGIIPPT